MASEKGMKWVTRLKTSTGPFFLPWHYVHYPWIFHRVDKLIIKPVLPCHPGTYCPYTNARHLWCLLCGTDQPAVCNHQIGKTCLMFCGPRLTSDICFSPEITGSGKYTVTSSAFSFFTSQVTAGNRAGHCRFLGSAKFNRWHWNEQLNRPLYADIAWITISNSRNF